ncbi:MAG: DNA-3-methyladenine glycosylase 2 family protein [Pseudomonas sp.]|nr:DNA-3-methyladenine glycosylase 2 family protein [Pseudomonas sp.]
MNEPLLTPEAVARHLQALVKLDPRLVAVCAVAGEFAPRIGETGFAGLARIICGQQVSVASANAIYGRFQAVAGATVAHSFLALGEEGLLGVGLSRSKHRTLTTLAEAVVAGGLDFDVLGQLPAEQAISELVRHKGVGPWTAEIYLMFSAGHPDIFPAGDLALQKAVGDALGLAIAPDRKALISIAQAWAPHRATAALLFWKYYHAVRRREGVV